jgi:hypothetical protein
MGGTGEPAAPGDPPTSVLSLLDNSWSPGRRGRHATPPSFSSRYAAARELSRFGRGRGSRWAPSSRGERAARGSRPRRAPDREASRRIDRTPGGHDLHAPDDSTLLSQRLTRTFTWRRGISDGNGRCDQPVATGPSNRAPRENVRNRRPRPPVALENGAHRPTTFR